MLTGFCSAQTIKPAHSAGFFYNFYVDAYLTGFPPTMTTVMAYFLFHREKQWQPKKYPGKKTAPLVQAILRIGAHAFRAGFGA